MKHGRLWAALLAVGLLVASIPGVSTKAAESAANEGTFTVAAMNVDGLPLKIMGITLNGDGPGEEGSLKIGQKINELGWDIIGTSEDFNYHSYLVKGLTQYECGTYRGKVSGLKNNTDGLELFWKKTLKVTGEKWTSWNTSYSTGIFNTGNGADGMIDKGYRYYQATVADGINIDIYILHMDADSDQGDIDAREAQLKQLADAIKSSNNKNPIIIMGDTNCRYTREHLKTILIDGINADSRFTIQDTWVEKVWNGTYPTYGASAMVAKDKGGTYDYPQAEIVDKVFYINNTDSDITLTADSHTVATDFTDSDGTALADHWPVVVQFRYKKAAETVCTHQYQVTSQKASTCIEKGFRTYTCSLCQDSYTEELPLANHQYHVTETVSADCTHDGYSVYTCDVCKAEYTADVVKASGHHYENGICTICKEKDPNWQQPAEDNVLGTEAKSINSGSNYMIAFRGTTGNFALGLNSNNMAQAVQTDLIEGMRVDDDLIWNFTAYNGGYLISTQVNRETYYLGRTTTYTGYGYKVGLQTEPCVWYTSTNNSTGSTYLYTRVGFWGSKYYLRYYNASQGWIATTRSAGVRLYQVK